MADVNAVGGGGIGNNLNQLNNNNNAAKPERQNPAEGGGRNLQKTNDEEDFNAGDNGALRTPEPTGLADEGLRAIDNNNQQGGQNSNSNTVDAIARQNTANQLQRGQNVDEVV